jgi:hypothetical protein
MISFLNMFLTQFQIMNIIFYTKKKKKKKKSSFAKNRRNEG